MHVFGFHIFNGWVVCVCVFFFRMAIFFLFLAKCIIILAINISCVHSVNFCQKSFKPWTLDWTHQKQQQQQKKTEKIRIDH